VAVLVDVISCRVCICNNITIVVFTQELVDLGFQGYCCGRSRC
jgi:hypothetical protein